MSEQRVHIRRGRRTDFTAVMGLLAAGGEPIPPPDRITLRRFRGLVNDLGADFYLALVDGTLAGLVHVTYARQLSLPPLARLDRLVVAAALRRRGIGTQLLSFVQRRARQRGCGTLSCVGPRATAAQGFLASTGFHPTGDYFVRELGNAH